MGFVDVMFDGNGNLNLANIFVNSWFFGYLDFGFLFILFAVVIVLAYRQVDFRNIISIVFLLSLVFASLSGSLVMWAIVILIAIVSGLRFFVNVVLRV